ncbi:MAG TPA: hypothetical protein VK730_02690 [Solirubrobacteraceae bacterium]|jgi:hypothetical protein|nr:hypothetical protein [Solirubrobacteraceae bacterium]
MLQAGDPLPGEVPDGAESEDERLTRFDEAVAEIAARVEPAYRKADGWLEQTRAGLVELLRFCDERPDIAHELLLDSIAWGPEVLARRSQLLDTLAAALDRARAEIASTRVALGRGGKAVGDPALITPSGTVENAPPPRTAENLVGASVSWTQTRLMSETGSFVELAPSLMAMIVHPYLGPKAAKRELERPLARGPRTLVESAPELVSAAHRGAVR